jgi:hypothetical protein
MDGKNKIRVGILLNKPATSRWAYSMLEEIMQSDFSEIVLVIYNGDKRKRDKGKLTFRKIFLHFNYLLSYAYDFLDSTFFKAKPNALEIKDLKLLFCNMPSITVIPKSKGLWQWFPEEDIEKIKQNKVDVLLRLGFSILKGELLQCIPYGIWSLHHGDNKVNRGGPPGFWELYLKQPVTGSILQILSEKIDGGKLLYKSYAATHKYSVHLNKNAIYLKSAKFIIRKLKELHNSGFDFIQKENQHDFYFYDRPLYTRATNLQIVKFCLRLITEITYKGLLQQVKRNQWFLLYGLSKNKEIYQSLRSFKKIIPPNDRFWADPCVIFKDNTYFIFVEEKLYSKKNAHISLIKMDEKGNWQKPEKILETDYHLSYPFVFEYENNFYMMPETKTKNTVELFKCTRFPDQWSFHATILPNIKAVDPTLFYHSGKWWLFLNIADGNSISRNDEMFIFISDSPFGPFKEHKKNPVLSDVRRSRPAGKIFSYKNKIYRPSQDCSITYGYALRINEILVLTESEFVEKEIDLIEPLWDDNIHGIHSFCFENNLTIADAFRKQWKF